jgi:hypothetical protein
VLRAAGEIETMQENIQDWLEMDEGDPGVQLLTRRNCCSDNCFYLFIFIGTARITKFSIFLSFRATICFINPHYHLIQMTMTPIHLN